MKNKKIVTNYQAHN